MVQKCTKFKIYDNSGVQIVKCFKKLKFQKNQKLNKLLKVSIQSIKPQKKTSIKAGQIYNALLIKSRYAKPRFNGQKISFDVNGGILINNIKFKQYKTRNKLVLPNATVFGLIQKEFRLYSIKLNIKSINIL